MRMMLQARIDATKGTEALTSGRMQGTLEAFAARFKPEATYFLVDDRMRSCLFVFDMQGSQQMPEVTEPFFALGCDVVLKPCMTPEDLGAGLSASGL